MGRPFLMEFLNIDELQKRPNFGAEKTTPVNGPYSSIYAEFNCSVFKILIA
jgi:hypothetical protein